MIPFPLNENWFSFFVADHLLVAQLCTNPKINRSLLSCLKVTQCSTSEIQVMTTGPLPVPSKCKSGQLNTSDDPLEVVERKDTARKTWTKEFIENVQTIIYETPQRPIRPIARDLGVSHITVNACVKEDLKCRSYRHQTSQILTEKTKNLRLIKSVRPPSSRDLNPLDYFVWSYVGNITNMTSHNTKASLIAAIRRVFVELLPALVKKAYSQFQIRIEVVIEAEGGYIE